MENEITERLDGVIALVEEMKEIILDGDTDAPLAFLEAAQDAQDQIGRILRDALYPLLEQMQLDKR